MSYALALRGLGDNASKAEMMAACFAAGKTPIGSVALKQVYGCLPLDRPADLPADQTWPKAGCSCPPDYTYDTSSGVCGKPLDMTQTAALVCSSKTTTYLMYGAGALVVGLLAWKMMK